MRVTKEQAAENRDKILLAAARLFRERGMSGAGVDALTEAAGMTHGSLYSQFGSKDALTAAALDDAAERARQRGAEIKTIAEAVTIYLSAQHRDNPGSGCFMATLGGEMRHQSRSVRRSFTDVLRGRVDQIAALLSPRKTKKRDDDALQIIATMVGAIMLARAVDDPELSDRLLAATRTRLLAEHV